MSLSKLLLLGLFLAMSLVPSASTQSNKSGRSAGQPAKATPPVGANPLLLKTMQQELDRAMAALGKSDPAPYFISYSAREKFASVIVASQGALLASNSRHDRLADISVRVGNPDLDNTHDENRASAVITTTLPLEDKADAIARVLWINTDRMYKRATQTYLKVKTSTKVRAEEEDSSPDFSKEEPQVAVGTVVQPIQFDQRIWEERIRSYSTIFTKYPEIETSSVILQIDNPARYFISTEGSRLVSSRPLVRILALGSTRSADGMELARSETFDASSIEKLAPEAEIRARIQKIAEDLIKLRQAPVVEPYSGPALLSGRAAAVFFHEVVGHRLEGQRQRGQNEGQTFTKKINQAVLPSFLSIEDDPTLSTLEGVELSGRYDFDSEGQKSRRVELISDGVLKEFLMSRMPVKGFLHSNGHGRAQDARMPVGRQGNLIVRSSKSIADSDLRAKLIEQVKEQGKPYGLYFEDIAGGFTLTMRNLPQAFKIMPLLVWKVYSDGKPDELVRGVDIIGTPLTALNRIVLTGQKIAVFNGECGAESGSVPVSAASPAMLFSEIEVQKVAQGHDRPPVLPPPPPETAEEKSIAEKSHGDPILKAMLEELKRSQEKLQLGELQRPYYIDYQITELQDYSVDAMLGAIRDEQRRTTRFGRVVVRIGDYNQDSFYGRGVGTLDVMPLDNSELALRHQLWLATDRAYKGALSGLSEKEAALKTAVVEHPVPDFSREKPVESIHDLVKIESNVDALRQRVRTISDLFRADPDLETSFAGTQMTVVNRYYVNTEGTVTRNGKTTYQAGFSGSAQASDGMRLERSHSYSVGKLDELPSPEQAQKDAQKLIASFADLRKAPMVEDEYRGPVLLSADAATDLFAAMFVPNILAGRPALGSPARTRGEYASYYKSRVLPDFFSVVDDPHSRKVNNITLIGSYDVDDEGVKADPVTVVEKGILTNYLMSREPIRDFTHSNGHGRGATAPHAAISNLIVKASNGVSFDELRKKLLQMCTDQGRPYGYYVETFGAQLTPRLLWRVYANDGHMELVRGAVLHKLDTRSLSSDIVAAGNDEYAFNRTEAVDSSIVAPSILFGELEIQRANKTRDKLPDYPAPPLDK